MNKELPPVFLNRLRTILPKDAFISVLRGFSTSSPLSVRINTLKTTRNQVLALLKGKGITYETVSWTEDALILNTESADVLSKMNLVKEGYLYRQGLSSMLPVIVLRPQPGDAVLDMCAAPGSKTSQMAAMMQNQGSILAIERVRRRYYKLRSVTELLGVKNVSFRMMDARRFRPTDMLFNKILVDAPCSSEGRFKQDNAKTYAYWSLRKIKEMVRKQRGLMLSASRLLKPGGSLVYSTCSFAPEENEGVIDWLIKKTKGTMHVAALSIIDVRSYPALTAWQRKTFDSQIENCLRVFPDGIMEGFFIAKLIHRAS